MSERERESARERERERKMWVRLRPECVELFGVYVSPKDGEGSGLRTTHGCPEGGHVGAEALKPET